MRGSMMNGMDFPQQVVRSFWEYRCAVGESMYGGMCDHDPYRFSKRAGKIPRGEGILCQEIFNDDVGNIDNDLSIPNTYQ